MSSSTELNCHFSPLKAGLHILLLATVIGFGLLRVLSSGLSTFEDWIATLILFMIPGGILYGLVRQLRLPSPVLRLDDKGITDKRQKRSFVTWEEIASAEIKRRTLNKLVHLQLTDGSTLDLDSTLLNTTTPLLFREVSDRARCAHAEDLPPIHNLKTSLKS